MWIPATPARIISLTVRPIMKALPHPVSTSTTRGREVTPVIRLASSQTSVSVVIPRSGRPKQAFATPAPERYIARKPTFSAIMAEKALIVPTICRGLSSASAPRRSLPASQTIAMSREMQFHDMTIIAGCTLKIHPFHQGNCDNGVPRPSAKRPACRRAGTGRDSTVPHGIRRVVIRT